WGRYFAPKKVHELYFKASVFTYPLQTWRDTWIEIKKAFRTAWATVRDVSFPLNYDWAHKRYDPPKEPKPVVFLPEELYAELDQPYVPRMKKEAPVQTPEVREVSP